MEKQFALGTKTLHLVLGDITELQVDAIVNAANEQLILGAGVAGAIRRKGGSVIQEECNRIGGTFTGGGLLKATYVIHAVGPRAGDNDADKKLASATKNCFRLAEEKGLKSIAFPAISTGVFGFPAERCALIMLMETVEFLQTKTTLKDIYFCLWGKSVFEIFERQMQQLI